MDKISYDLAKQLKDAGFPYEKYKGYGGHYPDQPVNEAPTFSPTLSELIEACGEKFDRLLKGIEWSAYWDRGVEHPPLTGYGSTPEEAVANLWLALNKKP